jgi:uncharacterized membrane protein
MNKKMKAMVIGSVLLNVLLVGFVIGDVSHRFHKEHFYGRDARELESKLPGDKAELFFETVERVHLNNRDTYKQVRKAREEAMRILGAPEFDEAAYRLQVEKLHELRGLMKRRLAGATIELARTFSQEERRALAQHLKHSSRHSRDKRYPREARTPYRKDR